MLRKITITLLCLVALLVAMVLGFVGFVNTESGQRWLQSQVLETVISTLQTRVKVKEINVSLTTGRLQMYGVEIDDQKGVRMLKVDTLEAGVSIPRLLDRNIILSQVKLSGADIILYKEHKDSVANYQFMVDALKPKKKRKHKMRFRFVSELDKAEISRSNIRWDIRSMPRKEKGVFDANHVNIKNFHVVLNGSLHEMKTTDVNISALRVMEENSDMSLSVRRIHYRTLRQRNFNAIVQGLQFRYQDKRIGCETLGVYQSVGHLDFSRPISIKTESLTFRNNNGKPRKNTNRPARGAFDPGHMDADISLDVTLHRIKGDTVHATINKMKAYDKGSGLKLRNVSAFVDVAGERVTLTMLKILLDNSQIRVNRLNARYNVIPGNKEKGTKAKVQVMVDEFPLTAKTVLKDIAQPFAPVLSNFTTPLNLSVTVGGDLDRFTFRNILINTPDKRLRLTAQGDMCDITVKRGYSLHFNNIHLDARSGIKEQIVNHFSKKTRLKMLKQMKQVGDIIYNGKLGIVYKRQDVSGRLSCKYTNVDFDFSIDGWTKMMTGTMSSDSVDIGEIMNVKKIWIGPTKASYSINVANIKRSQAYIKRGGRLPIGWLKASISSARVKFAKFKSINTTIESDGVTANGTIVLINSLIDMDVAFDYTQTDSYQGLKIHPKMRLHKKLQQLTDKIKAKQKDKNNKNNKNNKTTK